MNACLPNHLTRCGLPGIELIPYGTHACHFYASREELIAAIAPYCVAGLEAKERCIWIAAPPLSARAAIDALRALWSGAEQAIHSGALRILDFDRWYAGGEGLLGAQLVEVWLKEEEQALAEGYSGLRITGNASFLRPEDLAAFMEYERAVTDRLRSRRIIALCSYLFLDQSDLTLEHIVHAHNCAFEQPDQNWQVVTELTSTRR